MFANDMISLGKLEIKRAVEVKAGSQTTGWHINKYRFPKIWSKTQGESVKVAVIDTAIDVNHPDLQIHGGYDFVNNTGLRTDAPLHGHGTHVAGIIGAKNNNLGIVGVAPKCKLYSLAVLNDQGSGSYGNIIRALDWCIENGMDVVNMSLGGGGDSKALYEAVRRVYDAGITMVCAAGNSAWERGYLDFPGTYNETMAIAAIKQNMQRAEFSSIGPNIDICAPGYEIVSTTPSNTYSAYSGTSMASPFVAGLVALMISKHRSLGGRTPISGPKDVRDHLTKVAHDVSFDGQDNYTGYGLVNPLKSLYLTDRHKLRLHQRKWGLEIYAVDVKFKEDYFFKGRRLAKKGQTRTLSISGHVLRRLMYG